MELFDRIQEMANRRHLSLRELNEKAGLGTNAIYRWKKQKPSADKIQAVADALNVSTDYLLGKPSNETVGDIILKNAVTQINSEPRDDDMVDVLNNKYKEQIELDNRLPPEMAFSKSELVSFPIIGTIKAGPNGLAYDDYMGTQVTNRRGLNMSAEHFYLKVSGDSMTGDGILDGEYALIEKTDVIDDNDKIYAVVYDDEIATIKHVIKTDNSVILRPSNPAYQSIEIKGVELQNFHVIGRLKQVVKVF